MVSPSSLITNNRLKHANLPLSQCEKLLQNESLKYCRLTQLVKGGVGTLPVAAFLGFSSQPETKSDGASWYFSPFASSSSPSSSEIVSQRPALGDSVAPPARISIHFPWNCSRQGGLVTVGNVRGGVGDGMSAHLQVQQTDSNDLYYF